MTESVYFFDERQHLIRIVKENDLIEVVQEKEITASKEELMNDTLNVSTVYDEELKTASYMAVKETTDSYSLYRIIIDSEAENTLSFVGISFAPDELESYVVKNVAVNKASIKSTLQKILAETEWGIGVVGSDLPLITDDFSFLSIRDALKKIQAQGCEILFSYKIDGIGITEKWLDVSREIGIESNQRFTYGEKALSIVKEQDRNQVYTSLIGRGRGEDVGDGKGKRIEFTNIEWKKANGKLLDKPKGQNWLEIPEMTQQYGIPLKNGGMRKREKVITFDEEEDPEKLLQATYDSLIEYARPLVQFKTEILGGDTIGNTVTIHRHDRNYHYQTRIFKVKIDRLTGKVEAGLGDNITRSISKATSDLKGNMDSLEEKKMTFYDSEEISKWQDDIIRGAKGGSIKLMNGIETGKSNSREPYQQVFMNGDSLENSSNFLVMNSDGIGFIKDKFTNKPKTAWTIDGKFNADFIQAGTLEGVTVQTKSDKNFQIKLQSNGTIAFRNQKKNEEEAWIGATVNRETNEPVGVSICQIPGYQFSIGSAISKEERAPSPVFEIPKESNGNKKIWRLYGQGEINGDLNIKGKLSLAGDLHINGKLFLNGKEITGNGNGSGGNNGVTPPELTTDQEKNAWAIWQFFKSKGWTEQSIAGMLGNIQSESQIMPDIDEWGGGGGYGLTQWTPKSKLVDWCTERGLDHRTIEAQCQRIQWEMENNVQWFYNPERPDIGYISFREFTQLTNITLAADYFIALYEHPKDPYQPIRGQQAHYWYDKLAKLKPGTSTGKAGLAHLESLSMKRLGNGQCYAIPAEYSGFLGGCGLGAGTQYGLSHVIGNTEAAADIGRGYNWAALGWKVIENPSYEDLVVGAIINWRRGGNIGGFNVDYTYGHTGVIRGITNDGFETYEQNIGLGQVLGRYERTWVGSNEISSIVIPPK
ncbi:phage tail spike protein [Enterococcus sp. 5H]|uniref:phage tail spike protein n=1 Tax=Enterococcus sp. 5H TaxID=1229490 RepID=UPI002304C971|nr:phage tail spike protein [Enterococcus sp. 5H]MDA9472300.1 putative membrane protein [Enterococcus sp. 5H]